MNVVNVQSASLIPQSPELSSRETAWPDIYLDFHSQPGYDLREVVSPCHQIIVFMLDALIPVERRLEEHIRGEIAWAGDVLIAPTRTRLRMTRQRQARCMDLCLESTWLEQVNRELVRGGRIELIPKAPSLQDKLIQGILLNLKQELETTGLLDNIYVEQLQIMLALHLLRNYTTRSLQLSSNVSGLSQHQLRQVMDYIHVHLDQVIKLEDIANLLGMSQYYFCRLFRQSVGVSPYKYVIQQRVERAKKLLRQSRTMSIAAISLECGFASQSSLCKHFRNLTGMTPKVYRRDSWHPA